MSIKIDNYPVADNIAEIIEKNGWKQKAIAKAANLDERIFNDMLNGRRIIRVKDIAPIARALNVKPNDLYGIAEEPENEKPQGAA